MKNRGQFRRVWEVVRRNVQRASGQLLYAISACRCREGAQLRAIRHVDAQALEAGLTRLRPGIVDPNVRLKSRARYRSEMCDNVSDRKTTYRSWLGTGKNRTGPIFVGTAHALRLRRSSFS